MSPVTNVKSWLRWSSRILCVVILLLSGASPALSAEATPFRVLIVVSSDVDRELLERVRGQVSDLDVELTVAAADQQIATQHEARIWFTRINPNLDRVMVHLLASEADAPLLLTRDVGSGRVVSNGELSSATLEAAALVVRGALSALLQPAPRTPNSTSPETGTDTEPAEPSAEPNGEPLERHQDSAKQWQRRPSQQPREPADSDSGHWGFSSEARWEVVADGAKALSRMGPRFAIGGSFEQVELLVLAAVSLKASQVEPHGELSLRRYLLGGRLGRVWRPARSLALDPGLVLGMALYARGAASDAPGVVATSDKVSKSVLMGPEVRLGWAPGGGALELALSLGVYVVPGAPRIGHEVEGRFVPTWTLWRLQPNFALGLKFFSDRSW